MGAELSILLHPGHDTARVRLRGDLVPQDPRQDVMTSVDDAEQRYSEKVRIAERAARAYTVDEAELRTFKSWLPELRQQYVNSMQALEFAHVFASLNEVTAGWTYHHTGVPSSNAQWSHIYGEASLVRHLGKTVTPSQRIAAEDIVFVNPDDFHESSSLYRILGLLCYRLVVIVLRKSPGSALEDAVASWMLREQDYVTVLQCKHVFRYATREERASLW